jgi:hypothetical protein
MKWIKIESSSLVPQANMLVTDGDEIGIQYNGYRGSITPKFRTAWTHFMLLDDISLPQKQDYSCSGDKK